MAVESGGGRGGVVDGVRVDVRRLYDSWMELVFPRQRDAEHSVLGRWRPETLRDRTAYWTWATVGVPLIAVLYPLALVGFAARFNARRFDSAAARLGAVGVVLVALVTWGLLTAVAYVGLTFEAVLAVGGAGLVAAGSAGLAVVAARRGGRATTVLLAYPLGVTAVFLPPVVAALYSPAVADVVLPRSDRVAIYVLDELLPSLPVVGRAASDYLRENYQLVGGAYALMWLAIAVPVGWLLGLLVTLADVVRPAVAEDDSPAAQQHRPR